MAPHRSASWPACHTAVAAVAMPPRDPCVSTSARTLITATAGLSIFSYGGGRSEHAKGVRESCSLAEAVSPAGTGPKALTKLLKISPGPGNRFLTLLKRLKNSKPWPGQIEMIII